MIHHGSNRSVIKSNQNDADFINEAIKRLVAICPAWKTATTNPKLWMKQYRIELTEALIASNITSVEQINKGINSYRKHGKPFLPSPGELANLCNPQTEANGLTHNTGAYKQWKQPTGQRQICHKRSHDNKKTGMNKICELRKLIKA